MIYAEEKEPPSRPIRSEGVVPLVGRTLRERHEDGVSRFSPTQPVGTGVRPE